MANSDLRRRFGQRLRELRRRKQLSLEALAHEAKLSGKFIQSIETGRQAPTIDTVEKLADGLSVPVGELFVDAPQSPIVLRARARQLIGKASDPDLATPVRFA